MTTTQKTSLPDVQASVDGRNIPITRVGIRGVTLPIVIATEKGLQHTVATFTMTVSLPADKKGTHMSRFIALMDERQNTPLEFASLEPLMRDMLDRLGAKDGTIEFSFPFFIRKTAPVSHLSSLMNYTAGWKLIAENGNFDIQQEVIVPVTSLCPCSKEISQYGAHNQRSHLRSLLTLNSAISLEEQIRLAEQAASCELWARLKRGDEKYVTEHAYENPKFVEDLVRDMAQTVRNDPRIRRFVVEAENFESIHNHSAYAYIEG